MQSELEFLERLTKCLALFYVKNSVFNPSSCISAEEIINERLIAIINEPKIVEGEFPEVEETKTENEFKHIWIKLRQFDVRISQLEGKK